MAKFDDIFNTETKRADPHPKRVTKWIHYSKLKDSRFQYRMGKTPEEKAQTRERIENLADLIDADGEVLQDLLVRKTGTDEYEVIAGHHRRDACRLLVEERHKEQYALLPCVVQSGSTSEVRTEFAVYSTNGYGKKTSYEIMCELERMKHLLETYPEEFPHLQTGRMVEKLEKQLGMDKTTIGEYLTISNNLGEQAMERFHDGSLKKSAAVELAGLPEKEQDELLEQGILSHKSIKAYKKEKKEKTQPKHTDSKMNKAGRKAGETDTGKKYQEKLDMIADWCESMLHKDDISQEEYHVLESMRQVVQNCYGRKGV